MMQRISRRRLLQATALGPAAAVYIACSDNGPAGVLGPSSARESGVFIETATPPPTPTPEPFVVAAGEDERRLMAGTPQETGLYVYGSGQPGPIVMALGGVHGNEPAGWPLP